MVLLCCSSRQATGNGRGVYGYTSIHENECVSTSRANEGVKVAMTISLEWVRLPNETYFCTICRNGVSVPEPTRYLLSYVHPDYGSAHPWDGPSFCRRGRWGSSPRVLTSRYLNRAIPRMIRRHKCTSLPDDLKLPDGRITFGTHLTREINNRERVRRLMRHVWASTTERYYRAEQKVVVAGNIAKALRAEALRLTIACQRPITHISERPEQIDILARNPGNVELEYGSCGRDVERQGSCRMAKHCFECPLLVPWVSKRHNYVAERDEYLERAQKAENTRDRENLLYHASLAEAYITLIYRCRKEKTHDGQQSLPSRQRRPRKAS